MGGKLQGKAAGCSSWWRVTCGLLLMGSCLLSPSLLAAEASTPPVNLTPESFAHLAITPDMLKQVKKTRQDGSVLATYTVFEDALGRPFKHGIMTVFAADGSKEREVDFLYGISTGTEKRWHANNVLAYNAQWEGDSLKVQTFDESGKLLTEKAIKKADYQYRVPGLLPVMQKPELDAKDLKTFTAKNEQGAVILEFTYYLDTNGQKIKHGVSTDYYADGKKKRESHFSYGLLDGLDTWWYPTGEKWMELTLAQGNTINRKVYSKDGLPASAK